MKCKNVCRLSCCCCQMNTKAPSTLWFAVAFCRRYKLGLGQSQDPRKRQPVVFDPVAFGSKVKIARQPRKSGKSATSSAVSSEKTTWRFSCGLVAHLPTTSTVENHVSGTKTSRTHYVGVNGPGSGAANRVERSSDRNIKDICNYLVPSQAQNKQLSWV